MKIALLLIIVYSITAPQLIRGSGDNTLTDSVQRDQFKTNNQYQDILEELDGTHLRITASHVSLFHTNLHRSIYSVDECINLLNDSLMRSTQI